MKTNQEKVFELLYESKLAWNVVKKPLIAIDDNGNNLETESSGIFKSNGDYLGTVGPNYQIFQNSQMAEMIIQATDQLELPLVKGGYFGNGRKVYIQVELDSKVVGNSNIKRNITCLNSHDGSTSIGFGTSNTVVICQNTFYRAFKDLQKIKHTTNMNDNVRMAVMNLASAIKQENKLIENFERFTDAKIEDSILSRVIKNCFNINLDDKGSTRKFNQISTVSKCIETDIKIHGNNLWSLFNGITRYTNHEFKTKDESHLVDGYGFKINNIASNEILSHVSNKTLVSVNV